MLFITAYERDFRSWSILEFDSMATLTTQKSYTCGHVLSTLRAPGKEGVSQEHTLSHPSSARSLESLSSSTEGGFQGGRWTQPLDQKARYVH